MEPSLALESKLTTLLRLQAIDRELDAVEATRGALPQEIEKLRHELTAIEGGLEHSEQACAELEQEIEDQRAHIKSLEKLLKRYQEQQVAVRNNREYDAITKEIDLQQLDIKLAEKKIKDLYKLIEEKNQKKEQDNTILERSKHVLATKQESLNALLEASASQEKKLTQQRKQLVKQIEDRLLTMYQRIKRNVRNNIAVVQVERGACGGCFSQVPPQTQIEVRQYKAITLCEYCGRIIAQAVLEDDPSAE